MKNNKYFLQLFTTLLILVLSSCAKSPELPDGGGEVVEGEPAIISMNFKTVEMDLKTRMELTQEKEEEIHSIAVFIFNESGYIVSQTIHEVAGKHSSGPGNILRPNGSDIINIESYTGNNRDIYIIANYHSNLIAGLRSVSSTADMVKLMITMLGNPMAREFGLCKVAHISKQNVRKNQVIPVQLEYASAKITIKVINKSSDVEINGWTADGLPLRSYVVKRDISSTDPTFHDAVDVTNSEHFYNDFADQNFEFENNPNLGGVGDVANPKEYSTTFYMYENRRGNRISKNNPPGWTAPNPATDYKLKSWFAPEKATRVRIYGRVVGGESKSFMINHYLGADNYGDYNISRGSHYTYTITINGINDIDIDTNVEQTDLVLDVRPPADLKGLDAHSSSRPFVLYTNEILDSSTKITAEVLESVGSLLHPDWLDLSPISTSAHHVRKSADPLIAPWQQEADDNTYVRPKFIPNKKTRAALGSYTPPTGAIGVEHPDDDTSMPYVQAFHRMCKVITDIPTKGSDSNIDFPMPIFLHISEYPYSSVETYREAVVRFSIARAGQETRYIRFVVRQYPPHVSAITPDDKNSILLVERTEEYEHTTHASYSINLQISAGMQWGKFDLPSANNLQNGETNTLYGVYKDITPADYYKATNYVKKYGGLSGGWSKGANGDGEIPEGAGVTIITSGAPHSNVVLPNIDDAYNSVYNITAARYCHEKNKDINGDGDIDKSETFWYFPSVGEVQLFWTYKEALKMKEDYYWTSTQVDADSAYAVSMLHETSAPHLIYNGVPRSTSKAFISTIGPPRVRCVRRIPLGQVGAKPMHPFVSHRANGTTVIDCSNLPSAMYTTQSKNGIKQGSNDAIHVASEKVFKKFEVQRVENALSDYNSLHIGDGKCSASKGWRLPTQREMLLIYSVKEELESNSVFEPFDKKVYWTMSRDLSNHYTVNFNNGLAEYGTYFDQTNKFGYRCIKELP